jgi:hypothetical protein
MEIQPIADFPPEIKKVAGHSAPARQSLIKNPVERL